MMRVLLVTHVEPVIHGQALMAKQLVEVSKDWEDIDVQVLNAVYAENRAELGGGSVGKFLKLYRYGKEAVRMIEEGKIEVVIVTPAFFRGPFLKDSLMIRRLKKTGVKMVAWVHMDPERLAFERLPGLLKSYVLKTLGMMDQWVACAPSLAESWPAFISGKRGAVANGMSLGDEVGNDGEVEGMVRICYLSAIDREKGWRELLEASRVICSEFEDVVFDFYGDVAGDEDEVEVNKMFANHAYADRVRWHGSVWGGEKVAALSSADLFVMPSHTEQFSIVILEAMAYGLPIVATNVGATKDALDEKYLVEPRSVDALVEGMRRYLNDRTLLIQDGERNRLRHGEYFTKEAFGRGWHQMLKSMA